MAGRPKFFRDPIHDQIRYDNSHRLATPPEGGGDALHGWLLRNLIDTPEFQRLRHVRQNGLTNLVFHGAEHSRFAHSMGAAHLAMQMYDRIVRNTGETQEDEQRLLTTAAALLHDVGHGPFSHTLEEVLDDAGIKFDHEKMSQRIIVEEGSSVHSILRQLGEEIPQKVAGFIDKTSRVGPDHWMYRIVSSQLDADRLDYLLRDARSAGLPSRTFDLVRLLDMLLHIDGHRIAVDRRAIEAVEGYLLSLDQMYRAVYYHHTARAATFLLSAVLRRAIQLTREGTKVIPETGFGGVPHPLNELVQKGLGVELEHYSRLGEYHIWQLIEEWRFSNDQVLADLASRVFQRRLPKCIDLPIKGYNATRELHAKARALALRIPGVTEATVELYVTVDSTARTSYKRYDWRSEGPDESIWMVNRGDAPDPRPIEDEDRTILDALKKTMRTERLLFPEEVKNELLRA